jgi:hypothetical protein
MRGSHRHLLVRQPIEPEQYPHPRIAERNRAYEFPFSFVIPEELPIAGCNHTCANDVITAEHKRLPPSMGDPLQAGNGPMLLDDLAPHMSKIFYHVRVRVSVPRPSDGKEVDMVDLKQRIRLVPEMEERPPVNVEDQEDDDNVLHREKVIKKGTFQKRLGHLKAEISQPASLVLPPPQSTSTCPVTTSATITLRFDPSQEDLPPPRLGMVTTRLKASTFFSTAPFRDFPTSLRPVYTSSRGVYYETLKLSSRNLSEVTWRRHDACSNVPRDQGLGTFPRLLNPDEAIPSSTLQYNGGVFYTTNVRVPIALPKNKAWVPTFHSCLVSRVYQLEISLSIVTPSKSLLKSSINLRVPMQISAMGGPRHNPPLVSDEEVAAIFAPPPGINANVGLMGDAPHPVGFPAAMATPRPSVTFAGGPPPGYSFLAGASHGTPVRIPSPFGFASGCG